MRIGNTTKKKWKNDTKIDRIQSNVLFVLSYFKSSPKNDKKEASDTMAEHWTILKPSSQSIDELRRVHNYWSADLKALKLENVWQRHQSLLGIHASLKFIRNPAPLSLAWHVTSLTSMLPPSVKMVSSLLPRLIWFRAKFWLHSPSCFTINCSQLSREGEGNIYKKNSDVSIIWNFQNFQILNFQKPLLCSNCWFF